MTSREEGECVATICCDSFSSAFLDSYSCDGGHKLCNCGSECAGVTGVKPLAPKPKAKVVEDIPGVPTAAWARVNRGVPASDPFQPGEGFMLMVDAARFLPGMPQHVGLLAALGALPPFV